MYKLLFLLSIGIISCQSSQEAKVIINPSNHLNSRVDSNSFAQLDSARITHLSLNIRIDFDSSIIKGVAAYNIKRNGATQIHFDIKDLEISRVFVNDPNDFRKIKEAKYEIIKGNEYGDDLIVTIDDYTSTVQIAYKTTSKSSALQWLRPQQTYGKKLPFLYTQGFAILTRTWIPIQDSPGIKITYNATVAAPRNMLPLMSANNPIKKNIKSSYTFVQSNPIPPYLIALAVGDISYQKLGNITGVYAEPGLLDAASEEFEEIDKMLTIAESIYGAYQWNKYDLFVLPPSFPYGGMENPQLSFITPTILAGDRSLTSLIAHELAHSWSSNLITNATWNDFWLNEGLTVYIERRIMKELKGGDDMVDPIIVLAYQDLLSAINVLTDDETSLKQNIGQSNPDDAMTDIAYEKGFFFLREIEKEVGEEKMDAFMKKFIQEFSFKSITTEDFIDYLYQELLIPENADVNIEGWVYSPGLPSDFIPPTSEGLKEVDNAVSNWKATGSVEEKITAKWSTTEWLYFLRNLPDSLSIKQLTKLDDSYQFTTSKNAEVLNQWFQIAIRNSYEKVDPYVESFLMRVGRRKYLMPLYSAYLNNPNGGKEKAIAIYSKARPNYHFISTNSLDQLLGVENE